MGENKKKYKALIYLLLVMIFFFIPFVSSIAVEQNTNYDIKHPVRLDGGLPDNSVDCFITIFYPNRSVLIDYQNMSRSIGGNYYNYTLNENQTSTIGEYVYDITCLSDSVNKTQSFDLFINPGGVEPSETKTDSITRTIYFISAIGLLFFIAFIFSREKNATYRYTYLILSALSFLIAINFSFISLQNDVVDPTIQQFFSSFTAISYYAFWFLGFLLAVLWIFSVINTILLKNNERKMRKFDMEGQYG